MTEVNNSPPQIPASVFSSSYRHIKKIGDGSDGSIELYEEHKTDLLVAVKTVKRPEVDKYIPGYPPDEVATMLSCSVAWNHPNIITFYDWELQNPQTGWDAIQMEYCAGGDLDALKTMAMDRHVGIPEPIVKCVYEQIASALAFLHSEIMPAGYAQSTEEAWIPILHRDVKPGNILLKYPISLSYPSGNKVMAKLADFGDSTSLGHCERGQDYTLHWGGTPDYRAPEFPLFTTASDIWSLGASMYFLCLGEPPVDGLTGAGDGDEADDITWRNNLQRTAGIHVDTLPVERRSQWDILGSAEEEWEITYSTWLDNAIHAAFDLSPTRRASAWELVEYLGRNDVRGEENEVRRRGSQWEMVVGRTR